MGYKNIDLSAKGILIVLCVAAIIGILIFFVLPKVMYILNFPSYKNCRNFEYEYLYKSSKNSFNNENGSFQEIYNRGCGKQIFKLKSDFKTMNLKIDCLNRKGVLYLYIEDPSQNKVFSLQIPPNSNVVKDMDIKLDRGYFLVLDHHYTYGGLYIKWNYKNGGGAGNRTRVQKR